MKITGKVVDVSIDESVATVVIASDYRVFYLHAEPRMLIEALEDAYPEGDVIGQRIECEIDGSLLMSFQPAE